MNLPQGAYVGTIENPLSEGHAKAAPSPTGRVEVLTDQGSGILIVDRGTIVAACYREASLEWKGNDAVAYLRSAFGGGADPRIGYVMYNYTEEEYMAATRESQEEKIMVKGISELPAHPFPAKLDDRKLERILSHSGVIAVSVFFEGFPVQSQGEADFEQVAAMAEDFLRAGKKASLDMGMGMLDQIVLEGHERKCIIAPYGDLYLCLLTEADTPLGLIRLAIKNIQQELK